MSEAPPAVEIILDSVSEAHTIAVARALATTLVDGDVVALDGPLGAGKTRFARGLAEGLGIDARDVCSPTFVLRHDYEAPAGRRLVHLDAYRLAGPEELETIGWDELLAERRAVVVVEWAERLGAERPADRIDVTIEHAGPEQRRISITGRGARAGFTMPAPTACPTCGAAVPAGAETAPFCSTRCRMADLGAWFNEGFRISRPAEQDDDLGD